MSGFLNIEYLSNVPIMLRILDKNEDQYPQAEIRDSDNTLLTTLDLVHQADGLYIPSTLYTMPDETFITATYIVYSDVGHVTESELYLRDVDVFCKINIDEYKADVSSLAPSGEYNTRLANIQTDLDNPDQYKADVSSLAPSGEYNTRLASVISSLQRTLGLLDENSHLDNQTYNSDGNLTSARKRIYSVAGSVGTANDVIATYKILASWSGRNLQSYMMVRV
jgi:hypothetical protein